MSELKMRYYLRFTVKDQPGVLAVISKVFADQNISIETVIQKSSSDSNYVPLIIMTHEALEGDMQKAMKEFARLDQIHGRVQLIRVEEI
jgi:homoserine dehydrogenase